MSGTETLFREVAGDFCATVTRLPLPDNVKASFLGFVWEKSTQDVLYEDRFDTLLDAVSAVYLTLKREAYGSS